MIVKGRARSGPAQLAAYLLRDGERPALIELWDGSDDLHKAFMRWHTIGEGTRGEKTLYHAQIAPAADYAMTPEQFKRAAQILAEELGMADHPRAIVVHLAGKLPHAHVVFQRTDAETMTMWDDGQNYAKHEKASQRMELEFKHEHVPGKHAKRDRKKQPEFPRQKLNQDEAQQEKRTGLSKDDRIKQITALHAAADSGQAFKAALEDAGYILAKGDRGYIVVDQAGGHSVLSRNIDGLRKKHIDAFMAGVELDKLPTVDEAKALQSAREHTKADERAAQAEKPAEQESKFLANHKPADLSAEASAKAEAAPEVSPEQPSKFLPPAQPAPEQPPVQPAVDAELEALQKALAERQARDVGKWADLHAHQLRQLEHDLDLRNVRNLAVRDATDREQMEALRDRHKEQRSGIKGFIDAIQSRWNPQQAAEKAKERRREIAQLKRRHEKERKDYEALLKQSREMEIENLKDRQSLKLEDLKREQEEERERYVREHHEAKRILAGIESERLKEELEHNDSLRDGPPPPKLGK